MVLRVWIVMSAILAISVGLKAEEPKPDQPYSVRLGDKLVTSVTREITKGTGLSREELLKAARESIPINIAPADMPLGPVADIGRIVGYVSAIDGDSHDFVIKRNEGEIEARYWLEVQDGDRVVGRGSGQIEVTVRDNPRPITVTRKTSPRLITARGGWPRIVPSEVDWISKMLTDGSDARAAQIAGIGAGIREPRDSRREPLAVPLLRASARQKIKGGHRRFHLAWTGGTAPFRIVLSGPNGQPLLNTRVGDKRLVSSDVELGLGLHRVRITDATGASAEGVLEAVKAMPPADTTRIFRTSPRRYGA
jgi:hypothetical protein